MVIEKYEKKIYYVSEKQLPEVSHYPERYKRVF